MRVHVEQTGRDFVERAVSIWVLQPSTSGDYVLHLGEGGELMRLDEPEAGVEPKPTLRLRLDVAEALGPALMHLAPASTVQAEALTDARGVRDRLLTLVEGYTAATIGGRPR